MSLQTLTILPEIRSTPESLGIPTQLKQDILVSVDPLYNTVPRIKISTVDFLFRSVIGLGMGYVSAMAVLSSAAPVAGVIGLGITAYYMLYNFNRWRVGRPFPTGEHSAFIASVVQEREQFRQQQGLPPSPPVVRDNAYAPVP